MHPFSPRFRLAFGVLLFVTSLLMWPALLLRFATEEPPWTLSVGCLGVVLAALNLVVQAAGDLEKETHDDSRSGSG